MAEIANRTGLSRRQFLRVAGTTIGSVALSLAAGGAGFTLSGCSGMQKSGKVAELAQEAAAGSSNVKTFVDSVGREVIIPTSPQTVVPSGPYAQVMLTTLCPEKLIGLSSGLSATQKKYLPQCVSDLPVFGRYYGKNADMNYEYLISANPDVLIDAGQTADSMATDMDNLQNQTGVPCAFVAAEFYEIADAYRTMGKALDCEERGNKLGSFVDDVIDYALARSYEVSKRNIGVLYSTGAYGYQVKAAGSIHSTPIELAGFNNVAKLEDANSTEVSPETVMLWQPDVVLLSAEMGFFDQIYSDGTWATINAVKNHEVYEVPYQPYEWLDSPPSAQTILGAMWLGNLLCPDLYDFDMIDFARDFFSQFWNYDLTKEEAQALMSRSTYLS